MTKGKDVYAKNIVVKNDPKSKITLEDRKQQANLAQTLFDMNENLAYKVYELDETLKTLDELEKKDKSFTKIKNDFQKQKEKMVITTGDNYVGSAEPQLREKLATLYASIASQFAAPTNSQLQNFETVKDLYDTSLKELEQLNSKNRKKIEDKAKSENIPFVIKTKDEFING